MLEEAPDNHDEERSQEDYQRLDLGADITVYAWYHDRLISRPPDLLNTL